MWLLRWVASPRTASSRTSGGQSKAGRAEQQRTLKEVFDAFELIAFEQLCRVIEPPRAVVHWRASFE
jgi:hypothetical protein